MLKQFAIIFQGFLGFLLGVSSLSPPTLNEAIPLPFTPANFSTLGAIVPHCFRPDTHQFVRPTNLADCRGALRTLAQQPGLTNRYRFSRNHRRGIQVPQRWEFQNCVIFLNCGNDYDADTFSYMDVLRKAKLLVDHCVKAVEGELAWGGVDKVGTEGLFYVSVNGRPSLDNAALLQLANLTSEATFL